jgi:hypothetical protein
MKDPDACLRDVEAGKPQFYGRFVDPHNATCWRYQHVTRFAEAIAGCGRTGSGAGVTTQSRRLVLSPADSVASQHRERAGSATMLGLDVTSAAPKRW